VQGIGKEKLLSLWEISEEEKVLREREYEWVVCRGSGGNTRTWLVLIVLD